MSVPNYKAIILIIKAIRELARLTLPYWKANDIEKILDEAQYTIMNEQNKYDV